MNDLMTQMTKNNGIRKTESQFGIISERLDMVNMPIRVASAMETFFNQRFFALKTMTSKSSKHSLTKRGIFSYASKCLARIGYASLPIWISFSMPSSLFGFGNLLPMFNGENTSFQSVASFPYRDSKLMQKAVYMSGAPSGNMSNHIDGFSFRNVERIEQIISNSLFSSHTSIIQTNAKYVNGANSAETQNGQCRASRRDYERLSGRVWRSGVINIIPVNVPAERHDMTRPLWEQREEGNRKPSLTAEIITILSPMDTWFTSNTGSTRAISTYHEWQTDTLDTPGANAQIEGNDVTAEAVTATVRLGNYTQILNKVFFISETQRAIVAAGRNDEVDYQTLKMSKSLARDIEYALVLNATSAAGASATARQLKGVLGWITSNVGTVSATTVALTEAIYNTNLAVIWKNGGYPTVTLVGAYNKQQISGFTSNVRRIEAEEKKLVNSVDVYESDFGMIMVRLHHILNDNDPGYVVNLGVMELWVKAWLRPINRIELAKTGSADKYKIEAELTLESRNQIGSGMITGLYYAYN